MLAMSNSETVFVLASLVVACCARVARFPEGGESLSAEAFSLETGGKGFNVAVGIHRLGANVDGLIALGNDFFGSLAGQAVLAEGLPPTMLQPYDGPTGAGVGFINTSGENCIAVYPGANALLDTAAINGAQARIEQACAVVAQFETGDAPIARAFAVSHAAGGRTFLNPSPYRKIVAPIRANCDVLVVNFVEAVRLAADEGMSTPKTGDAVDVRFLRALGERLFDGGLSALVVTAGASGAWLLCANAPPLHQPAYPIQPIDTIGAGDAFLAGLVAALCGGAGWQPAMVRAAGCGALVAGANGVLSALPTEARLADFLADHAIRRRSASLQRILR
jgi:ribokinase